MSEMMNDYEMTRAQLAHLVEETQGVFPGGAGGGARVPGAWECGLAFEYLCDALRGGKTEISPAHTRNSSGSASACRSTAWSGWGCRMGGPGM